MSFAHKTRVGVLRGGPSPEYDVSLNTGRAILSNLPDQYEPLDIFISKDGVWHLGGIEKEPCTILKSLDLAVNAMHGRFGEDGAVQKMLESFDIPYTGSDSLSSAVSMNKEASKYVFKGVGIKTPYHLSFDKFEGENALKEMTNSIYKGIPFPIIIKPANSGSSLGVSYVDGFQGIEQALRKSFEHSDRVMVEEFVSGKEVTCGVIEDFRGADLYALLPVEIIKSNGQNFHDYGSKYPPPAGQVGIESRYKVPANLRGYELDEVKEAAALAHRSLGLRHYSRSDFILHPKRGLFCLETNSLPEITHRSSFIKSLESLGGNIKEFLANLLPKALKKQGTRSFI